MRSASSLALRAPARAASISTPWRSMRCRIADDRHLDAARRRRAGPARPRCCGHSVLVHVQRHLAVLARVLGGARDVDLRERDLVGALAAQVFVAQALAAEVALGQALQAVRLVRLEHVALQQGVVRVAAHRDAVVGEDVQVVLDVLARAWRRARVLQPGPQPRQHLVAAAAARARRGSCAPAARRRRGRARRRSEMPTMRARMRVERIGLGVEGHQSARPAARSSQASRRSQVVTVSYSRGDLEPARLRRGAAAGDGAATCRRPAPAGPAPSARQRLLQLLAPAAEAVALVEVQQRRRGRPRAAPAPPAPASRARGRRGRSRSPR